MTVVEDRGTASTLIHLRPKHDLLGALSENELLAAARRRSVGAALGQLEQPRRRRADRGTVLAVRGRWRRVRGRRARARQHPRHVPAARGRDTDVGATWTNPDCGALTVTFSAQGPALPSARTIPIVTAITVRGLEEFSLRGLLEQAKTARELLVREGFATAPAGDLPGRGPLALIWIVPPALDRRQARPAQPATAGRSPQTHRVRSGEV